VALADVFDALTSERPYKPAFEVDHAVALMRDERGRHFDPEYLDLFLTIVDEVVGVVGATHRLAETSATEVSAQFEEIGLSS
jgi:putative two-component system response regulator